MTYHAKGISGGNILIPADLRRELSIRDGDALVVERQRDGSLSLKTVDQFLAENSADWGTGRHPRHYSGLRDRDRGFQS